MGELQTWLIYGLAAVGSVFVPIYCFHLACAPYRLSQKELTDEKASHAATKAMMLTAHGRDDLRDYVSTAEKFTLNQLACLLAGVPYSTAELTGSAALRFEQLAEWASQNGAKLHAWNITELRVTMQMHRVVGGRWPHLLGDVWILRDDARNYADSIGIAIPGLTDADQ